MQYNPNENLIYLKQILSRRPQDFFLIKDDMTKNDLSLKQTSCSWRRAILLRTRTRTYISISNQ